MEPSFSPIDIVAHRAREAELSSRQAQLLLKSIGRRSETMGRVHGARLRETVARVGALARRAHALDTRHDLHRHGFDYAIDAAQRAVLTLEALVQRGNNDIAHAEAGTPPVLIYKSEVVLDGATLPRPVNYVLLKILPPDGVEVLDWKRPYLIVDPRAGHGAGIGGFKTDSQVGVALRDGHPVYFVVFRPRPEPCQTLADVMRAEAAFVKEIARRHPRSPKPIIVGNCQGGWAIAILAAANPDITGPLVLNGSPLAYWSGRIGENPMRYNGGLFGGIVSALFLSDLGHGIFDGCNLVANFETLDPGRLYFANYFDLYKTIDKGRERFLGFERWWGGFHFMTEAEIRWIVGELFIGNKLARGEARIERGRYLDLKAIRSPIIVFASHGDNITPPQQALNWIPMTYADAHEIKICGQRIVYMVHDKVGHLGIFVSSTIAKKEHTEVASTMKTIEALPPGLYEMKIEQEIGEGVDTQFLVSFHERTFDDIRALDDSDGDEALFAAVARLSELGGDLYDLAVRPMVQALVTPQFADHWRNLHPARMQRQIFCDHNPVFRGVAPLATAIRDARRPAAEDNVFIEAERLWADMVLHSIDMMRDVRDTCFELAFLTIYGSPIMAWVGRLQGYERTKKDPSQLKLLPNVQALLLGVERGGFAEAVIRMLVLLAESRGAVRRDRLERSAKVLNQDEPFAALGAERRAAIIQEQSIIAEYERDRGIDALAILLPGEAERSKALEVVEYIAGPIEEMEPETIKMLQRFRHALGLPPIQTTLATLDPLATDHDGVLAPSTAA
jgi:pimeloyl-ACP methyl ester carboxylesterase/tellurite resistance protein